MTTATNSADLFKAEVAREEKALAREKTLLEDMERNAKMAEGARKKQVKNVSGILVVPVHTLPSLFLKVDGLTDVTIKDHPMLRHLERASFQEQQQKQDSVGFDIRDMKNSDVDLSNVRVSTPATTNLMLVHRE